MNSWIMWNHGGQISLFLFFIWVNLLMCVISEYHVKGIFKENIESFGEKLTNALITTTTGVSLKDCISLCQRRRRCLSINYMQTFLICELNFLDKSYSNSTFAINSAVLYTEKKSWKTMTWDPCSKQMCNINEECVEDNIGQTHCIVADCGINKPITTVTIRHADNGIGVYSKVTYRCEGPYILRGKPYIGCQTDGDWSPSSFHCLRECKEPWTKFQTSCYNITSIYGNWTTQKSYCNNVGAKLAEISSQNEQDFIVKFLNQYGLPMAWIGGSDFDKEGTWKWTNSNTIFWSLNNVTADAYYTWYPNQPDNAGNDENCLEIYGGKWNDRLCTQQRKGICEKNL